MRLHTLTVMIMMCEHLGLWIKDKKLYSYSDLQFLKNGYSFIMGLSFSESIISEVGTFRNSKVGDNGWKSFLMKRFYIICTSSCYKVNIHIDWKWKWIAKKTLELKPTQFFSIHFQTMCNISWKFKCIKCGCSFRKYFNQLQGRTSIWGIY